MKYPPYCVLCTGKAVGDEKIVMRIMNCWILEGKRGAEKRSGVMKGKTWPLLFNTWPGAVAVGAQSSDAPKGAREGRGLGLR